MKDSALTWGHKAFDTRTDAKFLSLQRILGFVAWASVLTMAASAWVFWEDDTKKLGILAVVNKGTILLIVSSAAGLGVVFLLTALRQLAKWRSTWNENLTVEADEWRRKLVTLQTQLT